MTRKYLNKISREYARATGPHARRDGLLNALLLGMIVQLYGGAVMGAEALSESRASGEKFQTAWKSVRPNYANVWRNGALVMMIAAYMFTEMGILGAKDEAKKFAEFMVKSYVRGIHAKPTESELRDVADLILANMSDAERSEVLETGQILGAEYFAYKMQHIARSNYRARASVVTAFVKISGIMDKVLDRNPGLDDLILAILGGKTKYNPKLIQINQIQK